jgi:competence protein ComGC
MEKFFQTMERWGFTRSGLKLIAVLLVISALLVVLVQPNDNSQTVKVKNQIPTQQTQTK